MKLNVLVFPGGTEIGLEIHRALAYCKDINLFSAGLAVSNHAPYVFANHRDLPIVNDVEWLPALNSLIHELSIDYVFPAHDDVVLALARSSEQIAAKVVSSPIETCTIARSKRLTYMYLSGTIPIPDMYDDPQAIPNYPVFLKPDRGQGSSDTHLVTDEQHLAFLTSRRTDYLVTEYLPGEEFTVDCFSDREDGLLFCGARYRHRTRAGIAMHTSLANDSIFREYALAISNQLTFYGAWFFQVKRATDGTLKLLEIAPRIAGTMAYFRVQGVNFPLLSLYEQQRVPIKILANSFPIELDRALISRYKVTLEYGTVYIDFDDTILFNGSLNLPTITFLYQCVNRGIRIVLLTKHRGDIGVELRRWRLESLFDTIVQIAPNENKGDHIQDNAAIFIDDSYVERSTISRTFGIPTFDSSMIEILLDERR